MPEMTGKAGTFDSGLGALVMLLRLHGVGVDPEQLRHRFGATTMGIAEILRCAKELGLKARSRLATWERLVSAPLPGIVGLRDGGFLLLGKVADGKALVQSPLSPRPAMMTRAEFERVWNGHLILMTRRAGLVDLSRRDDITWFLGAIHKYRRLLGEVLVASFFLQVFASPDGVSSRSLTAKTRMRVYGYLGWEKVFVLLKKAAKVFPNFERPSDLDGAVFDPIDEGGNWKTMLAEKLRDAGFRLRQTGRCSGAELGRVN
jgi:Peptidase C39 family